MTLCRSPLRVALLSLGLALLVPAGRTSAQHGARAPGTHYLLEGGAGVSLARLPGPSFDVSVGAGGRLLGTPLRGYALAQVGYGRLDREETRAWAEERRQDVSLSAGVRLYLALPDRLRVHLDVLGGPGWVSSELSRRGAASLDERRWYPQLILAPGAQFRLFRELSLGLRAKWLVSKTGLDALREAAGVERRHPWSLLAGTTWHF